MPTEQASEKNGRVRPLAREFGSRIHSWLTQTAHVKPEQERFSIPQLVQTLLLDAVEERATDLHLDPERRHLCIRFRIDGILRDIALIPPAHVAQFLGHIKSLVNIDPTPQLRPVNGGTVYALEEKEIHLRVTCTPTIQGEKISIRLLDPKKLEYSLEDLGLTQNQHEKIDDWLESMNGMVLVSGPTGSGKTTTLYALLHHLKQLHRSVDTIEDPVEYHIDGINQMQVNVARGLTYAEAIKTMLRLDPDFLMVGEIRDLPSVEAALSAASTGRVLLSSLHSRDAAGTVTTLRNFNVRDYEIIASLDLVIAQRLIRRLCPDCRTQVATPEEDRRWLASIGAAAPEKCWVAEGCNHCRQTGYRHRIGLFEVWRVNEEANELIRRHTDEKSLRQAIRGSGTPHLLEDGLIKAAGGVTSLHELRRISSYGFGVTPNLT